MNELDIQILKEYDINEVESIKRIPRENKDMWYVNDKYFLKKFADLKKLEEMLLINTELYQSGVPVAKYYKTNARKLYVELNNEYYTLADKIIGSHSENERYTENYKIGAFSLGQNIAKLHTALIKLSDKLPYEKVNMDSMSENQLRWILDEISEKKLEIRKEIIDYSLSFDELYHSLPRQLIHCDLHAYNILFKNGEITAFLDFEVLQINVRLHDICYYMRGEIDGKDTTDEKIVEKWLEIFKNLLSGYNTVSELKQEEIDALPYMFIFNHLTGIVLFSSVGLPEDIIIKGIKFLNWFYDNKSKFMFSKQDIMQE